MIQQTTENEPVSYSILKLPTKRELRKKGFNVDEVNTNSCREHPLAKWTTHPLRRGATYRDALDAVESANQSAWGLLKARIHFSDGSFDLFTRSHPSDPLTIKHACTYSPNGVFRALTKDKALESRERLLPRLRPLVDARGRHLCAKEIPKTFAPHVLYRDCPPPLHAQGGFDFSPVSHTAFLLRPGDHPKGMRDVKSDFMKNCTDYRPRAFLRGEVIGGPNSRHGHCAEVFQLGDYTMDLAGATECVNQRNRVVKKEWTAMGTLKAQSTIVGKRHAKAPAFPCAHQPGASAETREKDNGDAVENETQRNASAVAEAFDAQQPSGEVSSEERAVRMEKPTESAVPA